MRPPKNQLLENLYTSGYELMIAKTYDNYVGYYHSVAGKKYIGATYKQNAILLIPYTEERSETSAFINQVPSEYLKLNPSILDTIKRDNFPITRINYIPKVEPTYRYFIKRKNEIDAPIIEVNVTTYNNAQNSNFFNILAIYWDLNNEPTDYDYQQWEKQMFGITSFLRNISYPKINDIIF